MRVNRWLCLFLALALANAARAEVAAMGGTVTNIPGYRVHVFTNSGTLSVMTGGNVEVLVVAGGGGGGSNGGGGGGGGGLIHNSSYAVTDNQTVTVTIGAGGAPHLNTPTAPTTGGNSVFGTLTASGGGGGASRDQGSGGATGGSGGGGGGGDGGGGRQNPGSATAGQGSNGGYGKTGGGEAAGGGGGGAGGAGGPANTYLGGNGGAGLPYSISGTSANYAGGGGGGYTLNPGVPGTGGTGGGANGATTSPNAGVANTGGGGGGGSNPGAPGYGGSGIVIVRYALTMPFADNANGATNVTLTSAWLNGTLTATGSSATAVCVFWGTADGGTNWGTWAYTNTWAAPQSLGSFTTNVTGLVSDRVYYYRFAGANSAGTNWASSSATFMTTPIRVEKTSDAVEGLTPGVFTVYRASAVTNAAVTVNFIVSGTATAGVDYVDFGTSVTFAQGASNATVVVTSMGNNLNTNDTTVILTLTGGTCPTGSPGTATMTISNRLCPYYVNAVSGDDARAIGLAANPGTAWKTITHALSMVSSGDTINVMAGTYTAGTGESFPVNMANGVTLQGAGFLTTIIDAGLVSGRRVFTCAGISTGRIDGFTIQGGYGDTAGAVYTTNCYFMISNNRFAKNRCDGEGYPSVISCDGGALQIVNNLIVGNTSARNTIRCMNFSTPLIANNTIVGNTGGPSWNHGAIHVENGAAPAIKNCIIWNNTQNYSGYISQSMFSNNCVGGVTGGYPSGKGYSGVQGNISSDPMFVDGYFLSQTAAGQAAQSLCVGAGIGLPASFGLDSLTTRSDRQADTNAAVDMGFHFPTGYVVGAQVYVDASSGSDTRTLAQAINSATPWKTITHALAVAATNGLGWTINAAAGNYDTTTPETFPLDLVDTMTVQGSGYATTTIDAKYTAAVLQAIGVVRGKIDGFTIQGGMSGDRPLYFYMSSLQFTRNRVTKNMGTAGNSSGGIRISSGAPFFVNCLIVSNTAGQSACVYMDGNAAPVFENCTIATNIATQGGTAWDSGPFVYPYFNDRLSPNIVPVIRNCIIWGNTLGVAGISAWPAWFSYCDIQNNWNAGASGCISADPQFKAPGDFRLLSSSPCVNQGTNEVWMASTTDLDGKARKSGGRVDMGAYELQAGAGTRILFQ